MFLSVYSALMQMSASLPLLNISFHLSEQSYFRTICAKKSVSFSKDGYSNAPGWEQPWGWETFIVSLRQTIHLYCTPWQERSHSGVVLWVKGSSLSSQERRVQSERWESPGNTDVSHVYHQQCMWASSLMFSVISREMCFQPLSSPPSIVKREKGSLSCLITCSTSAFLMVTMKQ